MDPLTFFPKHITDLILQHLTYPEVIDATLVSPGWDEIIGGAAVAMKKIRISFSLDSDEEFEVYREVFEQSPRRYQHLAIRSRSESSMKPAMSQLMSKKSCPWKSVELDGVSFESSDQFCEFMSFSEPTVERIHMRCVRPSEQREHFVNKHQLYFPKLTILEFRNSMFLEAFINCRTLTGIYLKCFSPNKITETLKTIVLNSRDLSTMQITPNFLPRIFDEPDKLPFKLKTFVAMDWAWNISPTFFIHFLRSQWDSLEILFIDHSLVDEKVMRSIFLMPKINQLMIKGIEHTNILINWKHLNPNPSQSITAVSIENVESDYYIVKAVVDGAPRLSRLELFSLDQAAMEYLSQNATKLRSLQLRSLTATDFTNPNLFPTLECLSVAVVIREVDDAIVKLPGENRNRFVKLYMQSYHTVLD